MWNESPLACVTSDTLPSVNKYLVGLMDAEFLLLLQNTQADSANVCKWFCTPAVSKKNVGLKYCTLVSQLVNYVAMLWWFILFCSVASFFQHASDCADFTVLH